MFMHNNRLQYTVRVPGTAPFDALFVNASTGPGDTDGPWNSGDEWERIDDMEAVGPVDGGDGTASVDLPKDQKKAVAALAERTASEPTADPMTGVDLGSLPN